MGLQIALKVLVEVGEVAKILQTQNRMEKIEECCKPLPVVDLLHHQGSSGSPDED